MPDIIFVVPFALDATLRFVHAVAAVDGVRLSLISQEPAERLPEDLRRQLQGFERVRSCLDTDNLVAGVRNLARHSGGKVDALIGILEQMQVPLAETRQQLGIPGMTVAAAHNFRDKSRMKDVFGQNDLPCAKHQLCSKAPAALAFAESCGYPLVVKPPDGAGAKQTFRVENRGELEGYLRSAPPNAKTPVLLEEFLQGREFSYDAMSVGGEHLFASISHYYPTPLEVMQTPWIQWAVLLPRDIDGPEYAAIRAAAPRALDALGMGTGMTHMEWFERENGSVAISEVAARPPGAQFTSLISYAHDFDFYAAWARLVTLAKFEPPKRCFAAGAVFLRGQGEGRVVQVHGLEQAQRELGELVVEARIPQAGQAPASSYEGEGYVILRHPDTAVVEDGLSRLVSLLRVELG